jgi:hypothetical protein
MLRYAAFKSAFIEVDVTPLLNPGLITVPVSVGAIPPQSPNPPEVSTAAPLQVAVGSNTTSPLICDSGTVGVFDSPAADAIANGVAVAKLTDATPTVAVAAVLKLQE